MVPSSDKKLTSLGKPAIGPATADSVETAYDSLSFVDRSSLSVDRRSRLFFLI